MRQATGTRRFDVKPVRNASRAAWLLDDAIATVERREGLPFSEDEYQRRQGLACDTMAAFGADAYVVFRPSSVDWLTGFHSGTVLAMPAVVTDEATSVVLPAVEVGRAIASSCLDEVLYHGAEDDQSALLAEELVLRLGTGACVGVDAASKHTPPGLWSAFEAAGLRPLDMRDSLDRARMVLSGEEIAAVERAAERTGHGLRAAVAAAGQPGATDSTLAAAILAAIVPGADSLVRGEVFVATGWRGGVTHSTFANTPVDAGTTTFLEFSGAEHHYTAPVMRTLLHGEPTPTIRRLDELARTALDATLALAKPGRSAADIAAEVTGELGQLESSIVFHYTFGYSLSLAHGTSWLDAPPFLIHRDNPEPLEEGMLFHMPIVMRSFGEAAVGSSHTVLIEADGPRVMTLEAGPAELVPVGPPARGTD